MRGSEREKEDIIRSIAHKLGDARSDGYVQLLTEHWPPETEYLRLEFKAALDALSKVISEHWDRLVY